MLIYLFVYFGFMLMIKINTGVFICIFQIYLYISGIACVFIKRIHFEIYRVLKFNSMHSINEISSECVCLFYCCYFVFFVSSLFFLYSQLTHLLTDSLLIFQYRGTLIKFLLIYYCYRLGEREREFVLFCVCVSKYMKF